MEGLNKNQLKIFGTFFALQFISYLNLVINFRAIAHDQVGVAIVTDGLAGLIAWTMVKKIGAAQGGIGIAGVVLGGMVATWVGMFLTESWS